MIWWVSSLFNGSLWTNVQDPKFTLISVLQWNSHDPFTTVPCTSARYNSCKNIHSMSSKCLSRPAHPLPPHPAYSAQSWITIKVQARLYCSNKNIMWQRQTCLGLLPLHSLELCFDTQALQGAVLPQLPSSLGENLWYNGKFSYLFTQPPMIARVRRSQVSRQPVTKRKRKMELSSSIHFAGWLQLAKLLCMQLFNSTTITEKMMDERVWISS